MHCFCWCVSIVQKRQIHIRLVINRFPHELFRCLHCILNLTVRLRVTTQQTFHKWATQGPHVAVEIASHVRHTCGPHAFCNAGPREAHMWPLSGPHMGHMWQTRGTLCGRQLAHMWQSTGTEMAIKRHMHGSEQAQNWPMCGNCPGPQQGHIWQSTGT